MHFRPDQPDRVKQFEYRWEEAEQRFDMHQIQALARNSCLEDASEATRRDLLLELAAEAERRLGARTQDHAPSVTPAQTQGRQLLTVDLSVDDKGLRRVFRVAGQPVPLAPPAIPRALLDALRAEADRSLPDASDQARIGQDLYRVLLRGRDGEDLFPGLAERAWGLPPGSTARTLAVAVDIHCGPAPCDPWPLRLPWHLTAIDGEQLAAGCGWSFESTASGLRPRVAPVLSPEPPLLLYVDERIPGAARHGNELTQLLERSHGFAADLLRCADLGQLATAARRTPEPEMLYAYARADLDLDVLAQALGQSVSLIVLNLIGEPVPAPPPALVRERKVVCSVHPSVESDHARAAGARWLQAFLGDTAGIGHQRIAVAAFGPRVRLWSGCAGLQMRISASHGRLFRRSLIKLLLDRIAARREASDEVAAALSQGRAALGLVAAGTVDDHPELLPRQVWHHYQHYRETGTRDAVRRLELGTGPIPDAEELLVRFAESIGCGSDDWEDGLDREAGELAPGEHLIFSLEWRLPSRPADRPTGQQTPGARTGSPPGWILAPAISPPTSAPACSWCTA